MHAPSALRSQIMPAEGWDDLVLRFSDLSEEQTQCFNGSRWPQDQLERVACWNDTELVAAAALQRIHLRGTGVRLTVLRRGPLWRPVGKPMAPERLDDVYRQLTEKYASGWRDCLLLTPQCDPVANDTSPTGLSKAGFRPLRSPASKTRYFVDVSQTPDALRASLAQKWRYNLRKAEKYGLTVELLTGENAVQRFKAMHEVMVARKRFSESSPLDTLSDMMAAAQPALRPLVFIVSRADEEVAAAVIDVSGERAVYLYGATDDKALPLNAGYFLQWKVVEHLSSMPQINWYALGGGSSPNCSLHQFKRGLTGKTGLILDEPDVFFRAGSSYAAMVGSSVAQLRWWLQHADLEIQKRFQKLHRG
ncbi:MAG: GNAT family N-acetyltransferase [Pseudomonadota bacterium]